MLQQGTSENREGRGKGNVASIPEEVMSEYEGHPEALHRITVHAYERLAKRLAESDAEFGEDDEREVWLAAVGDYKGEADEIPKAAPGWMGHH